MAGMLRLAVSSHIGLATTKRPMRAGGDRVEQSHSIRRSQEIEARSVEAAPSSSAPSTTIQDIHDAKTQSSVASVASVASGTGNDSQRKIEIGFRAFDVISCIGTVISTIIAALMWLELRKERKRPELQAVARRIDALEAKQESSGPVFRAERRVLMREKRAILRRVLTMEAKGRAFESRLHQMSSRHEKERICT